MEGKMLRPAKQSDTGLSGGAAACTSWTPECIT